MRLITPLDGIVSVVRIATSVTCSEEKRVRVVMKGFVDINLISQGTKPK